MKITKVPFDAVTQAIRSRDTATPAQGTKVDAKATQARAPRPDTIELSAEGRALAKGGGLTPERTTLIRQRILQGAYDSTAIVDQVAQSILKSGDL
ncbi:MAG: hypothetical protein NTZ43_10040 [Gemmatimonadetes bacterium]|nr:hypothetical protein [Gemmatimonadota bacterium]